MTETWEAGFLDRRALGFQSKLEVLPCCLVQSESSQGSISIKFDEIRLGKVQVGWSRPTTGCWVDNHCAQNNTQYNIQYLGPIEATGIYTCRSHYCGPATNQLQPATENLQHAGENIRPAYHTNIQIICESTISAQLLIGEVIAPTLPSMSSYVDQINI
jgi:hypothetical protein